MQVPTSFCQPLPRTTPQDNGVMGWRPSLRESIPAGHCGIHREQGQPSTRVCILLDCIWALQTPTELNLHLLPIRGERKTRMIAEEFLPASDCRLFRDRTLSSFSVCPQPSLSCLIPGGPNAVPGPPWDPWKPSCPLGVSSAEGKGSWRGILSTIRLLLARASSLIQPSLHSRVLQATCSRRD